MAPCFFISIIFLRMLLLGFVSSRTYQPYGAALMWELGILPASYVQERKQRLSCLYNTVLKHMSHFKRVRCQKEN